MSPGLLRSLLSWFLHLSLDWSYICFSLLSSPFGILIVPAPCIPVAIFSLKGLSAGSSYCYPYFSLQHLIHFLIKMCLCWLKVMWLLVCFWLFLFSSQLKKCWRPVFVASCHLWWELIFISCNLPQCRPLTSNLLLCLFSDNYLQQVNHGLLL